MPTEPSLTPLYRAARALRVPLAWLQAEALAGRVPCLKIGRRLLFNVVAVEKTLAERAGREVVSDVG